MKLFSIAVLFVAVMFVVHNALASSPSKLIDDAQTFTLSSVSEALEDPEHPYRGLLDFAQKYVLRLEAIDTYQPKGEHPLATYLEPPLKKIANGTTVILPLSSEPAHPLILSARHVIEFSRNPKRPFSTFPFEKFIGWPGSWALQPTLQAYRSNNPQKNPLNPLIAFAESLSEEEWGNVHYPGERFAPKKDFLIGTINEKIRAPWFPPYAEVQEGETLVLLGYPVASSYLSARRANRLAGSLAFSSGTALRDSDAISRISTSPSEALAPFDATSEFVIDGATDVSGMSGAGIYNAYGQLVGLLVRGSTSSEAVRPFGRAIRMSYILERFRTELREMPRVLQEKIGALLGIADCAPLLHRLHE